jgi:hypothetical protein
MVLPDTVHHHARGQWIARVGDGRSGALSRQELTPFQASIGGTAIAQTFGPLKRVVTGSQAETMTLEIRSADATAALVLQQALIPKTTK